MPQGHATSKLAEMRSQIRSPYDKPAPALLSNSGQRSEGFREMELGDILLAWRTLSGRCKVVIKADALQGSTGKEALRSLRYTRMVQKN